MLDQLQIEIEKLSIAVKQGNGNEYLKSKKSYFDKNFPIEEKEVSRMNKNLKVRFLDEYMAEKKDFTFE